MNEKEHESFLLEVANEVDELNRRAPSRDYFRSRLKDLSKKVDAYEQSQQVGKTGQSGRNPLRWFPPHTFLNEYDPNSPSQKQPNEDEKLMICYVILAIVHDKALRDPQYDRIWFEPNYKGNWSFRDTWGNSLWQYLSNLSLYNQNEKDAYATRIKTMIEHALQRVNDDLAEKGQDTTTKRRRIWTCVKRIPRWMYYLVGFLAALLTCIYLLWWLWTKLSA